MYRLSQTITKCTISNERRYTVINIVPQQNKCRTSSDHQCTQNIKFSVATLRKTTQNVKIRTFWKKYRPKTDPKWPKGPYYGPRSVNKDPSGSTDSCMSSLTTLYLWTGHPSHCINWTIHWHSSSLTAAPSISLWGTGSICRMI